MPALPAGTVTFLFTDIEGSTRLQQQLRDGYADLIEEHHRLLREAIAAHAGIEVDTAGDGFFVAFARATDAIAAAIDAQRALSGRPWPGGVAVAVRMGLHTGQPNPSREKYIGLDVHRAARIAAVAHGGQVLCSQTTADLVERELPDGARLIDLGEHRLRDLDRPERLYQLCVPSLPAEYPPLRTVSERPNNLPLQLTSLIGRGREIEALATLLRGDSARLVTLTGPGGSGKTRLAIQVAVQLIDEFSDGAFFVSLADIGDAGLVAPAIAQTLDVREARSTALIDSLKTILRERALLLILDNFEQVLDAGPIVAELLGAAPSLRVIVTSRAPLHVRAEREFPVPSLALPDLRQAPDAANLSEYEAVSLFIDRARSVKPDFAVTDENLRDVAEICARLDGLPLAIELAAARCKLLPPSAMLARLAGESHGSPLQMLTGGARDLPARQRTLRETITWSYDLLTADEQALFRRLAVFAGGCTLEAIDGVVSDEHPSTGEPQRGSGRAAKAGNKSETQPSVLNLQSIDTFDLVASLVDKNLLRAVEATGAEARFGMLETVREFGVEILAASGELEAAKRAHAAHFLGLAEEADPQLRGPAPAIWFDRLEREHENLRAALRWLIEDHDGERALRLAVVLGWFWYVRGHLREARTLLGEVLGMFEVATASPLRAHVCWLAALCAWMLGDHGTSISLNAEALKIGRESNSAPDVAMSLGIRAVQAIDYGNYEAARGLLDEALAVSRAAEDRWVSSMTLYWLGIVALHHGDFGQARALEEEALAIRREIQARWAVGTSLERLAELTGQQGDYAASRAFAEESLEIARELGSRRGTARALWSLATAALADRDYGAARERFLESLAVWHGTGERAFVPRALEGIAALAASLGAARTALVLAAAAARAREELGIVPVPLEQAFAARWLEPVRQGLPRDLAEAALAEGRALPLEEAIELARLAAVANEPAGPAADTPAGGPGGLTARECELAGLISRGLSNREIAEALVLSERTVEAHVAHIRAKLSLSSRARIAVWAVEQGLATRPSSEPALRPQR